MTLANLITLLRLASTPVLLVLAWYDQSPAFLALLAAGFASDVVDGYIARKLGQTSDFGALLDTLSDGATYSTVLLGGWWLRPDLVRAEAAYFAGLIGSLVLPVFWALARFHRMPSYHTWLAKVAALLTGLSIIVLFAGGPAWPFRVAVPVAGLAALESIVISSMLRAPRANVRSLWHLLRLR